jgi:glycosyltransferase involved in cell wall biosynthesis
MSTVCLIVPCFNEAARLDFAGFARLPPGVCCLFVDDGSSDRTGELLRLHQSPRLRMLRLERNVGKAEAVRQGMLYARAQGLLADVEWVGYWDADMATPLSEVNAFLAYAAISGDQVEGVFGSRIYKLGSTIVRSYRRHLLGRGFATLAALLLRVDCYDSQCGAKLFRTALVDKAFREPFISRWIFDLEILLRLQGHRLIEYPVRHWVDVRGSKVKIVRRAVPTFVELIRMRRRYAVASRRRA